MAFRAHAAVHMSVAATMRLRQAWLRMRRTARRAWLRHPTSARLLAVLSSLIAALCVFKTLNHLYKIHLDISGLPPGTSINASNGLSIGTARGAEHNGTALSDANESLSGRRGGVFLKSSSHSRGHSVQPTHSINVTHDDAFLDFYAARLRPRPRTLLDPSTYSTNPSVEALAAQRRKLDAYLSSVAFRARQAARARLPARGIVINAGGAELLTNAILLLGVLRRHLNCTLPVHLSWHGAQEMDRATFAALQAS